MSAFLFVISDKAVKEMSTDELTVLISKYETKLNAINWDQLKQCTFDFDEAYGKRAGLVKLKAELEQREKNISEQLPHVTVPGYNPGK